MRTALFMLLLMTMLAAPQVWAAGGALGNDRNGSPYEYVIGYMYSGSQQNNNTREIFTSPDNYAIWLCPVCGRGGGSSGTALASNLYMPCYEYDVPATGGDMSIRYALVRHRHNNGQLSNDHVYIPINVPTYAGCYYGYDLTEPSGVQASAPSGWQKGSVTVQFSGGSDGGTSLPDWAAVPGDYGSGIHHYEYQINGGAWTGCPTNDPTVTITAGGVTTVTARVVDGAGNASTQTATATVYIDPASPYVPDIALSTEQWTNETVTVTVKDNGDTHSGVARTEYSLDGGNWATYNSVLSISSHGKHTIRARAIDNVGRISGTASKTALVDKVAPVISEVKQIPNSSYTEMTLNVAAKDTDSGLKGYAVTTENKAPAWESYKDTALKVEKNGTYYVWAADKAGNISPATKIEVVSLDIVPPVVAAVETQQTWDAEENWAKITATDDNSGVVAIGWASTDGAIQWSDANHEMTFTYLDNGNYNAYARDLAGNISAPYPFVIDHIDKHSPLIDSVEWNEDWSQSKTVTVKAHDSESGLGQYALSQTDEHPLEWQESNTFEISENGTYYLWVRDNVQRISSDADADSDDEAPGPQEILIETIDRARPVMDAILHSATDNAPDGMYSYPHFNEIDRPELLAHDLADDGWEDSGIKAIYYQYAVNEDSLTDKWLTYKDSDRPAMCEEYHGNIYAKAEDNAGNISDVISAAFMFEQTVPTAEHILSPSGWTNGAVEIKFFAKDNLSGVRDLTLPDGQIAETDTVTIDVSKNGVYTFFARDYCGNVLSYPVEISNIDLVAPTASSEILPDSWTNKPVTIRVTAIDPQPDDGYSPSGIKEIEQPDGTIVENDTVEFTVDSNGDYDFTIVDHGGNSFILNTTISNIDTVRPSVDYHFEPVGDSGRNIITEYGKTEYYNYDLIISATAEDTDSGIERYEYKVGDGEWMVFDPAEPPRFTDEQISRVTVRVWDLAGNVSDEKTRDIVLDKTAPIGTHTLTPLDAGEVTINFAADGNLCGVQSITRPDGSVVYGVSTLTFGVRENGDYNFSVWDQCGNLLQYTVTITSFPASGNKSQTAHPSVEMQEKPAPAAPSSPPDEAVTMPEFHTQETARTLTLVDLICMLLSILLGVLIWLRRKEPDRYLYVDELPDINESKSSNLVICKVVNAALAILSVFLFIVTQPLVWNFKLIDWWSPLFALLSGAGLAVLLWKRREESSENEYYSEQMEEDE